MIIAIDFDGTFWDNSDLWVECIEVMQKHGCRVICVSDRQDTLSDFGDISRMLPDRVGISLSSGKPKWQHMRRECNIESHVMIGDMPTSVDQEHTEIIQAAIRVASAYENSLRCQLVHSPKAFFKESEDRLKRLAKALEDAGYGWEVLC